MFKVLVSWAQVSSERFIVERVNLKNEFVTHIVMKHQLNQEDLTGSLLDAEGAWGHYFGTDTEASHHDYLSRVARGF